LTAVGIRGKDSVVLLSEKKVAVDSMLFRIALLMQAQSPTFTMLLQK